MVKTKAQEFFNAKLDYMAIENDVDEFIFETFA